MRIYKWLFNEITKLSVKYTVILALLIIVQNIMKPLVLLVYQYIASNDITIVLISVGVLFLVYIIKEIANNFADVITVKYSNLVEIHLLRRLYNSVANKNILLLNDAEYVLKLQRARCFIESSSLIFYRIAIVLICEIIETVFSAIIIGRISLLFMLLFLVMSLINNCTLKKYNSDLVRIHKEQDVNLRKQNYFSELLQNKIYEKEIRINKLFSWLENKREKYFKSTEMEHRKFSEKWSKINFLISFILHLIETGVVILAVYLLSVGRFSLGDVVALITGQSTIVGSVSQIIKSYSFFKQQEYQAKNLYELLHEDRSKNIELKKEEGFLRLENISFRYADKNNIDNLSLELKQGEKIALVGSNGSGKSTLIGIILGLYKPTSGKVSVNADMTAIFQDFARLQDLLKVNINMGDIFNEKNTEKMNSLLEQSFIDLGIFPLGLDTMLSKEYGGIDLSLGQWQKIALCRALYKKADVVIFDEPTSSLDPLEEKRQFETAFKLLKDKTVIIITHRVGITNYADRILFMDDGKIVEEGTQEQLLNRRGKFYELYDSQRKWY